LPHLADLCATLPYASAGQETASQQGGRQPNPLLTLSFSQGLRLDSNANLTPGTNDPQARSTTDLGFSYASATPISLLTLSANTSLLFALGSDSSDEKLTIDGPQLSFGYHRAVPSASLDLSGSVRRDEVSFLRDLSDFVDENGVIDLPDDFEDFEGEGTRRSADLDAVLSLRDDARFGIVLTSGLTVVDYQDVTSARLVDSFRTNLGVTLRFDLTEVTQVRAGLRTSRFDQDGAEPVTRFGFDLGGTIQRPNGQLSAQFALDDTEDGVRTALSFGRTLDRPLGTLSGQLGITRDAAGELRFTGDIRASRQLPLGSASLAFSQSVQNTEQDGERLVTSLSARWSQSLTPLVGLNLDALYSDRRDTGTDVGVRAIELGASLNRQLTRDWSLTMGYRHRRRDETGEELAINNSLFLTIGRSFEGAF
jgi:hypothetical protein